MSARHVRGEIRTKPDAGSEPAPATIDFELSGNSGSARAARIQRGAAMMIMPCSVCAGSAVCPFCHGRKVGCTKCNATGICSDCAGTGLQ